MKTVVLLAFVAAASLVFLSAQSPSTGRVLSLTADGAALDWPTFQGNIARTGVCDSPPIDEPTIAWSRQLGIMGYLNCPVIDGERVFVTSSGDEHDVSDARDGVYCLDLNTGEVLWHVQTPADACGISINETLVFVGDDGGQFRALSRDDGEQAWVVELSGSAFAQPVVLDNLVVAGGQGEVVACQIEPFKILWSHEGSGAVRGGISSDGERVFAAFTQGELVCLDRRGRTLWLESMSGQLARFTDLYPAPTVLDGQIYQGFARDTYYDVPALFSFRTDGTTAWRNQVSDFRGADGQSYGNIRTSPAAWGESLVYAEPYGNELLWVDRTTGKVLRRVGLGARMFPQWGSPVIAAGRVYIGRHDGGLYAVDFATGELEWMLYLGDHEQAGRSGLPGNIHPPGWPGTSWEPGVGEPIYATPAVAKDGSLVIGTGDGWLYCIREAR